MVEHVVYEAQVDEPESDTLLFCLLPPKLKNTLILWSNLRCPMSGHATILLRSKITKYQPQAPFTSLKVASKRSSRCFLTLDKSIGVLAPHHKLN